MCVMVGWGSSCISCISCADFLMLNAYGRGDISLIFCVSDLASLYAGAFLQFTTSRMGRMVYGNVNVNIYGNCLGSIKCKNFTTKGSEFLSAIQNYCIIRNMEITVW
jgi:hypothetical protein